eukprot:scaffold7358_cov252-Pinguiococcus_pyrenoidosus.AAC.13
MIRTAEHERRLRRHVEASRCEAEGHGARPFRPLPDSEPEVGASHDVMVGCGVAEGVVVGPGRSAFLGHTGKCTHSMRRPRAEWYGYATRHARAGSQA